MFFVYRLNSIRQCVPYLRFDVTLNISTHKPDDIGPILIAVSKECAVLLGICHTQFSILDQTTPDTYHSYIYTVLLGQVDNIVQMVPIAIDSLLVDIGEVPPVNIRGLSVDIISWHTINDLYLYHIIPCFTATLKIPLRLGSVQTLWQQPSGLALPEERLSVLKLQITLVIRNP